MAQHFDEPPKREKPQPVMSIDVECRLEGQPVHDEAVTRGKSTVSRSDGDSRGLVTQPLRKLFPLRKPLFPKPRAESVYAPVFKLR